MSEAFDRWEALQAGATEPLLVARRKAWVAATLAGQELNPRCGHLMAGLVGTLGWPSTGQPNPQVCLTCEGIAKALQKATADFDLLRRACEAKAREDALAEAKRIAQDAFLEPGDGSVTCDEAGSYIAGEILKLMRGHASRRDIGDAVEDLASDVHHLRGDK
jgi:hypothetical protein